MAQTEYIPGSRLIAIGNKNINFGITDVAFSTKLTSIFIPGTATYSQICEGSFTCVVVYRDEVFAVRPRKRHVVVYTRKERAWTQRLSFATSFIEPNPVITMVVNDMGVTLCSNQSRVLYVHSSVSGNKIRGMKHATGVEDSYICAAGDYNSFLLVDSDNNALLLYCTPQATAKYIWSHR